MAKICLNLSFKSYALMCKYQYELSYVMILSCTREGKEYPPKNQNTTSAASYMFHLSLLMQYQFL